MMKRQQLKEKLISRYERTKMFKWDIDKALDAILQRAYEEWVKDWKEIEEHPAFTDPTYMT